MARYAGDTCSPCDLPWPSFNAVRDQEPGVVLVSTSEPDDSTDYVVALHFVADQFGPWKPSGASNVSHHHALPGGV